MPVHEYYEELCALGATGQLSADELSEFNSHLKMCASCRSTSSDFSLILGQLPSVDLQDCPDNIAALQSNSYRRRFLAKAEAEGICFPADVEERVVRPLPIAFRGNVLTWALASGAVAAAVLIAVEFQGLRGPINQPLPPAPPIAQIASVIEKPELPAPPPEQVADPSEQLGAKLRDSQAEITALKVAVEKISSDRDAYRSESASSKEVAAALAQKTLLVQQNLSHTQSELDRTKGEKGQTEASLAAQMIQVNDLSQQLKARDAAIEQEHQLSLAAKDVRELMGARNLHIIDVADVDARGRSRKSFGRVFFVEDKSLIFYAFDLSAATPNAKVLFQAWGQREGSRAKPHSLGAFRIDDHAQRRWVLRVEDPKLLAGIDSLFVTVENRPDVDQPSSRKLVYAYLGVEPNHP